MRYVGLFVFALALSVCFLSCDFGAEDLFGRDDKVDSRSSHVYTVDAPAVPAGAYTVVVITDVHFGRESRDGEPHDEATNHFVEYLKELAVNDRPIFIICLGDVTEHGEGGEVNDYVKWVKQIEAIPNSTGTIHVYNAVGNHDLYNGGYDVWCEKVQSHTLYRFETPGLSWYFIDTASGAIGQKQYYALEDAFENDNNRKVILSHFPFYADGNFYFCMQNTTERNTLISLFARRKVAYIFSGHTHEEHKDNFGPFTEYNVPSLLDKRKWAVLEVEGSTINVQVRGE